MSDHTGNWNRFRGIAFVGNYLPRRCGIATFTYDLAESIARQSGADQPVSVVAMNDISEGYDYPDRVKFEVRQEYSVDYSKAADFLNFSRIDIVSLQHEYGIFGGDWGSYILSLMRDLHLPVVVTCHTVVKEPDPVMKEVFREIAAKADRLVVMSRKAFVFMEEVYGIDRSQIAYIPHGIPDVPFVDPSYYKDKFGVEGRKVLLTFGLLHPNKGIEYMIEALPEIVARHPKTTYLVLGTTHPAVVREQGESYRLGLQRKVRELGLEKHVLFHPRFVEFDELMEYLGAADIFVTPYPNLDQITSGTLSYAMGTGKAVVSTKYWHAEELLAEGRGALVPVNDPETLTREINSLLDDEVRLSSMRKKAYTYCRGMVWPVVARNYLDLFDEVRKKTPKVFPTATDVKHIISATNLPTIKLEHLFRLCDGTGLAHHARHTLPDWSYGYRLEDAAMALVVTAKYYNLFSSQKALDLTGICLSLVQTLVTQEEEIQKGLEYTRHPAGPASDTEKCRTLWGLSYLIRHGISLFESPANELFVELLPSVKAEKPRAAAYAIMGAANYMSRFPGATDLRRRLSSWSDYLAGRCARDGWMEKWDGHDWPCAAQALLIAAVILNRQKLLETGRKMIHAAIEHTKNGTVFMSGTDQEEEEETPQCAAAFIEALGAGIHALKNRSLLAPMRAAADWFLGSNRHETSLYDFSTGGCADALTSGGVNNNQGTEATLSCLLAFLTLHRTGNPDVNGTRLLSIFES